MYPFRNKAFLAKLRTAYQFEAKTTSIVVRPEELEILMRGHIAYVPFIQPKEFYYFFELKTDYEYFKRKYLC